MINVFTVISLSSVHPLKL